MKAYHIPLLFTLLLLAGCQGNTESAINTDCSNCGMDTGKYPEWRCKAKFSDEEWHHYCSPRCMFKDALGKPQAPDSVFADDYYHATQIDAKSAYFVTGSDIYGPMGHDLVPFETEEAAKTFMADHDGKSILRYEQVDLGVLDGLGR